MRYLKIYELFKEKKKGNYLTKEDQPNNTFNEYLYNNGFDDKFYICSECDSYKLTPIPKGGMTSPEWHCDNCGETNYAPKWMAPDEYEDYFKDKFKVGDYFIYSHFKEDYLLQFLSIMTVNHGAKNVCYLQPLLKSDNDKIIKDKRSKLDYMGFSDLKTHIEYHSNNLEDVKKYLEYMLDKKIAKKFNL